MATNKERIEKLEIGLGGLQEGMSIIESGVTENLHHIEETINEVSEVLLTNKAGSSSIVTTMANSTVTRKRIEKVWKEVDKCSHPR